MSRGGICSTAASMACGDDRGRITVGIRPRRKGALVPRRRPNSRHGAPEGISQRGSWARGDVAAMAAAHEGKGASPPARRGPHSSEATQASPHGSGATNPEVARIQCRPAGEMKRRFVVGLPGLPGAASQRDASIVKPQLHRGRPTLGLAIVHRGGEASPERFLAQTSWARILRSPGRTRRGCGQPQPARVAG